MNPIFTFIDLNKLSFFAFGDKKDGKYSVISDKATGWKTRGFSENFGIICDIPKDKIKVYFINIEKKFFVLDTDTKEANDNLLNFLETNKIKYFSTPSYNNYYNGKTYKNHYWFSYDDDISELYNIKKYIGISDGLDLITDVISEPIYNKLPQYIPKATDLLIKTYFQPKQLIEQYEIVDSVDKVDNNNYTIDYHTDLMKFADDKYKLNYNFWINFLCACKNENNKDGLYFDLFVDYSRCDKYKSLTTSDYRKIWNNFKLADNKRFTFASIAKEISEEKPEEYKNLRIKYFPKEVERINKLNNNKLLDKEEQNKMIQEKYLEIKSEVEKEYFKVVHNACFFKCDNGNLIPYTKRDIDFIFENKRITEKITFTKMWYKDPEIRTYDNIDFIPNLDKCPKNIFNKFIGFKYDNKINKDEINEDKIKFILDFIKYVCNNDETYYNCILDWISSIIQKPYIKTKVAPILYSDTNGVGKNTITNMISKLLDNYSTSISKIDDLMNNFNYSLCFKLLVVGDEITANAKNMADCIKNVITQDKMKCEKKGLDSFDINDYTNYIFTSNNEFCFKIDKTDRRFIPIQCNEVLRDKKDYDHFYNLLDDNDILYNLHSFFKYRTILKEPKQYALMENEFKNKYINHNMPAYLKMVYDEYEIFAGEKWTAFEIKNKFLDYAKKTHKTNNFSADKVAKDFKKEFEQYYKKDSKGNRYYQFPEVEIFAKELDAKRSGLVFIL